MASDLLPCAHCRCHAKSTEVACPACGEPLRRSDGSVPRTTIAVLLGLTAVGALVGGCSKNNGPQPFYGPAMTSGAGGSSTSSTSTSATGSTATTTGTGASSTSSGPQPFYGPAMTTSSSSSGGG